MSKVSPSQISSYGLDEQLWLHGYGLREPLDTDARTVPELLTRERERGYLQGLEDGRALSFAVGVFTGFGVSGALTAAAWGFLAWLR